MTNSNISNWNHSEIHIGTIKVGKPTSITFIREETTPPIFKVITSCNCMVVSPKSEKQIEVKFTPQPIPKHLQFQGFYSVIKRVNVLYDDGKFDELIFKAKIVK